MSCDALIIRGKVAQIASNVLAKECMIEEVIENISECGLDTEQLWLALQYAIASLSTSRLTGRIRTIQGGDYITIPIVTEFATMCSDILGPLEKAADPEFFPPPENGKEPAILTPLSIQDGRHLKISGGRTKGKVTVSIGDLTFVEHMILLRIDVLDNDVKIEDTQIVLSEFKWL